MFFAPTLNHRTATTQAKCKQSQLAPSACAKLRLCVSTVTLVHLGLRWAWIASIHCLCFAQHPWSSHLLQDCLLLAAYLHARWEEIFVSQRTWCCTSCNTCWGGAQILLFALWGLEDVSDDLFMFLGDQRSINLAAKILQKPQTSTWGICMLLWMWVRELRLCVLSTIYYVMGWNMRKVDCLCLPFKAERGLKRGEKRAGLWCVCSPLCCSGCSMGSKQAQLHASCWLWAVSFEPAFRRKGVQGYSGELYSLGYVLSSWSELVWACVCRFWVHFCMCYMKGVKKF